MVFRSLVCGFFLAFTVSNVSADEGTDLISPSGSPSGLNGCSGDLESCENREGVLIRFVETLPQDESKQAGKRDQNAVLTRSKLPGTNNVHAAGNVILAGQPSEAALAELSKRGFKTIVSLRGVGEERYDEAAVCKKLGMKFVRLPIQKPDDITPELLKKASNILASAKPDAGVMLHCASANRVGAVWLAFRVQKGHMAVQQARQEAAKVGLKTPQLEQKSLEFLGQ